MPFRGRALDTRMNALLTQHHGRTWADLGISGNIQAVTFDVGNTLLQPWPSVGHVYSHVASDHGVQGCSVNELNFRFAEAWRSRTNFDYSTSAWCDIVRLTFGDKAARLPESFFNALYNRFSEPDVFRVYPDVVPTLESLASRGYKLGVISNWDDRLPGLLERLKLHSYFDAIIVSCDIGFTKPSPVIFEQAERKLALPARAILHVGDSTAEDVEGALNAGLAALHLDRDEPLGEGRIPSLSDLEWLLERPEGAFV